jgi:hypothetical protein
MASIIKRPTNNKSQNGMEYLTDEKTCDQLYQKNQNFTHIFILSWHIIKYIIKLTQFSTRFV